MKTLGIFAWIAISSLANALVQSWVMQCLWHWFVAHEYGHGPSLGAWFGIATIARLAISLSLPHTESKADHDSADEIIKKSIRHSFGIWLGCMLALGMAWCVGSVMGWIGQ